MLIVTCINPGAVGHQHKSWAEFRSCVGNDATLYVTVTRPSPTPTGTATAPVAASTDAPSDPWPTPPAVPVEPEPPAAELPYVVERPTRPLRGPNAHPSGPQLKFIKSLGGSWRDAYMGTRGEASALLDLLKDESGAGFRPPSDISSITEEGSEWDAFPMERDWIAGQLPHDWASFDEDTGELNGAEELRGAVAETKMRVKYDPATGLYKTVPRSAAYDGTVIDYTGDADPMASDDDETVPAREVKSSEKLKLFKGMLDRIPEAYYRLKLEDGIPHTLRVSRPKKGKYRGAMKVQVVGADERLWPGLVVWPSGRVSVYEDSFDIEQLVLDLLSHNREAARSYAKWTVRCARCRTLLTDPRSKHYGIGPECEKHWPEYITEIDLIDAAAKGI